MLHDQDSTPNEITDMNRVIATSVAIALALGIGATTAAFADQTEGAEMTAVLKAPVTPTQAVKIAERGGGHAYDYGMEANGHGHWYEVAVLRGGAKLLLRIDASTGKILGSAPARGEDARGAHALEGSKLNFASAIAQAERTGNGPALEADAAGHGKDAHVDVDIIEHHGTQIAHYRVSMHNGQMRSTLAGSDS
ncbi:MAG: PepSY domain-containing protein [Rhodanobacteraceae bacterium]